MHYTCVSNIEGGFKATFSSSHGPSPVVNRVPRVGDVAISIEVASSLVSSFGFGPDLLSAANSPIQSLQILIPSSQASTWFDSIARSISLGDSVAFMRLSR